MTIPRRIQSFVLRTSRWLGTAAVLAVSLPAATAADLPLTDRAHHLRQAEPREWAEFPAEPDSQQLQLQFDVDDPDRYQTLILRQHDVKQNWTVQLNATPLGKLIRDENTMLAVFEIPRDALRRRANELIISTTSKSPDDIRLDQIRLTTSAKQDWLTQSTLECRLLDTETGQARPGRITLTAPDGTLTPIGTQSSDQAAIRTGVVYCLGTARLQLPAGRYRVTAGAGFEYGIDSQQIELEPGQTRSLQFQLRREVDTSGWVSCDTHVHTLTHSGHGDSSIEERMLTLAGEGIELPIATDHNKHIDYRPIQTATRTTDFFTPVIGNEVTTKLGHFNVFPIQPGAAPPDHTRMKWTETFQQIENTPRVEIIILNHARDVHSGFRPFGPRHHHALCGRNLDGWTLRANAMEVVNSAAQQTDIKQLFHDWMALANAGRPITPIGSSDSHDVARHFVGQGRTYIRVDDRQPGAIDVAESVRALRAGRVLVSCGLLAHIRVDAKAGPGDLHTARDHSVQVECEVHGPAWSTASLIELYANGQLIRSQEIEPRGGQRPGLKARVTWDLENLQHDVSLVAIATGPAVRAPHWPIAKPYQPVSPLWDARVIAATGTVRVDADGDQRFSAAANYAQQLVSSDSDPTPELCRQLAAFDRAVAGQAFFLIHQQLPSDRSNAIFSKSWQAAAAAAGPAVEGGYEDFVSGWRAHQRAVIEQRE